METNKVDISANIAFIGFKASFEAELMETRFSFDERKLVLGFKASFEAELMETFICKGQVLGEGDVSKLLLKLN